jgi:hypothetical protein
VTFAKNIYTPRIKESIKCIYREGCICVAVSTMKYQGHVRNTF